MLGQNMGFDSQNRTNQVKQIELVLMRIIVNSTVPINILDMYESL